MATLVRIQNATGVTTAAPVKQPTGTTVRTMLQVLNADYPLSVVEWGISFDGYSAATPVECELLTTGTVAATMTTALAAGDLAPFNQEALSNVVSNMGFTLSTTGTSFSSTTTTEGSITTSRQGDAQLVAPTNQYVKQFPLGQGFYVPATSVLRIRVTTATTVSAYCYVVVGLGGD